MNREEMTTTRKSTEHTEKRRLSKDTKVLRNSKRGAGRSFKGMLKSFALQPPRTNCNTPADGEERKPFTRGTHNTNTQKLTRAHRERKHTHAAHSPLIGHGHVRGGCPSQSEDSAPCVQLMLTKSLF